MLLPFGVVAFVFRPICPGLNTIAILQVVFPVSLVPGSVCMQVYPISIRLIELPLSFKDVSIYMVEDSLSVSLVVFPKALVLSPVRPNLNSIAMPLVPFPLPIVDCSVLKDILSLFFNLTESVSCSILLVHLIVHIIWQVQVLHVHLLIEDVIVLVLG